MGISFSLFLIAAGAVLAYAVEVQTQGFNLNTIGVILMIVGTLGILLSLAFWSSWGGFTRRDVVVHEGPRRRYVEEDL